jgi:SH3 domain-containing YSC84-like protein 1
MIAGFAGLLLASPVRAEVKEEERLKATRDVLQEFIDMPEGIPRDLVDKAECVAVVPNAKKLALGIGARFGKGAMMCRTGTGKAHWGAPLMIHLEGGSYGVQIGGQETDLVMLVMNHKGVDKLLESKLTLGADASVAAGPVGRAAEASTDAKMKAEILTYSRSRGVFAGLSLEGASLRPDKDANDRLYGARIAPRAVLLEGREPVPPAARALVSYLDTLSPRNLSSR